MSVAGRLTTNGAWRGGREGLTEAHRDDSSGPEADRPPSYGTGGGRRNQASPFNAEATAAPGPRRVGMIKRKRSLAPRGFWGEFQPWGHRPETRRSAGKGSL